MGTNTFTLCKEKGHCKNMGIKTVTALLDISSWRHSKFFLVYAKWILIAETAGERPACTCRHPCVCLKLPVFMGLYGPDMENYRGRE